MSQHAFFAEAEPDIEILRVDGGPPVVSIKGLDAMLYLHVRSEVNLTALVDALNRAFLQPKD